MEFDELSGNPGKSKTFTTKRTNIIASSTSPEELKLSPSKKRKLKENVYPAVTNLDPLLIPLIVKKISSYLVDLGDMKSIRTLSRLWRDECLDRWRATVVLTLTKKVIQTLVQAYLDKNNPPLEPTSILFGLFDKPFQNFRYPYDSDGKNRVYPLQLTDNIVSLILWEQFFSKAKYLDLADCILKVEPYFLVGFNWIFRTCPKLKRLDINPYYDTRELRNSFITYNENVGVGSSLEILSIGKSFNAKFEHCCSDYFRFKHVLCVLNQSEPQFTRNPFPNLFQMCPNLKKLWVQDYAWLLLGAARFERHQLESLVTVPVNGLCDDISDVQRYLCKARPPLKTLVLQLDNWFSCFYPVNGLPYLRRALNIVQVTITRLELYINYEDDLIPKNHTLNLSLKRGARTFSNLTHLKLCQDYRNPRKRLITFDFRCLRQMKKLKEFRYEMGIGVAEGWVKKKLEVKDIEGKKKKGVELEELFLPDLKNFHFHNNFTAEAVQYLGKVAANLETFEIVLDEENFTTAFKNWVDLRQITLLPCSQVPEKLHLGLEGAKLVDRSRDYRKASTHWFKSDSRKVFEVQQMKRFSKLTKNLAT